LLRRYHELDSLRGLAALTVVLGHCLITFPEILLAVQSHTRSESLLINSITFSPLHLIWAAHEAVILFFVLSGFVLSMPFLSNSLPDYGSYIIKRFCRIYIPYIVTVLVSGVLFTILGENDSASLSSWFNGMWSSSITLKQVLSFIFLIGFDSHNLNTVTWSLVHEMRISLFFPFIMIIIIKFNWFKSVLLGLIITIPTWFILSVLSWDLVNTNLSFVIQSFSSTIYYSFFFIIGAVFAKYRDVIAKYFMSLRLQARLMLVVLTTSFYIIDWIFPQIGFYNMYGTLRLIGSFVIDISISIGVLLIFMFALNWKPFSKFLNNHVLLFLGKISYSLYLVHPIILLLFVYFGENILPLKSLILFVPVISIVIAKLMYKYIELPSILLGKSLVKSSSSTINRHLMERKEA
jgi:peptidoglycan/LPS O-acetylase OafA/YrhL